MQEDVIDGNFIRCTYDSLEEFAQAAARRKGKYGRTSADNDYRYSWCFGASFNDAQKLARDGWELKLDDALNLAEHAVELCDHEQELNTFTHRFDVTGAECDVARYFSGVPENMIDFVLSPTSRVGKVITVCVGSFYSASMDDEALARRGQVLTALALALSRMGHAIELWADIAGGQNSKQASIRVLVKGANDVLDPAKILFAFAHPALFRKLGFAVIDGFPQPFEQSLGEHGNYMHKEKVKRDLPEGTIYLEGVSSSYNMPDVHEQLKGHLSELGLLAE